jgi:two-component system, sensor histidine kinase RegB
VGRPVGVRLQTLTFIRWGAVTGQAGAIFVVHMGLNFPLPLWPALAVVAASALLNLLSTWNRQPNARVGELPAAGFLAFDISQLAVLLYLTGGLENPFAFLLLAPVTVSATILSQRSTVMLCILALFCVTLLGADHLPLPWSREGLSLPQTYILGSWVALGLGIAFFASYTWRLAQEARSMSNALAATQLALLREQQLSALGGMAAAAAHELGSPLGTIAVATREISRDLPDDSPLAEDVNLLMSEVERCRDILAELAQSPQSDLASPFDRIPVNALVEAAAARHDDGRVNIVLDAHGDGPGPFTGSSAEMVHGLGNLIQNAVQFARDEVVIEARWTATDVSIAIRDDGPGFPIRILERLGEPYLSARGGAPGHMGLGIFIARTLLQRTRASVELRNLEDGGAEAVIRWRRADFEAADRPAG